MQHRVFQAGITLLWVGFFAYFAYWLARSWALLRFGFPLDYGEGPLLAQVDLLRSGTPFWQLYADPSVAPYAVINYPPLYLVLTWALSWLFGSALIAGRVVSILATLAAIGAIYRLMGSGIPRWWRGLVALLALSIPIVREWGTLMRVDMLGVALGLWALVVLVERRSLVWAALLIVASLYVKPSLLAAPLAAGLWLGWAALVAPAETRWAAWRQLGWFSLLVLGLGGGLFGLLTWASAGWFPIHVVAANANRWEGDLAWGFWRDQLLLRGTLWLAGGIALAVWLRNAWPDLHQRRTPLVLMALGYFIGALVSAVGVGKVGAYSNYFWNGISGVCGVSGRFGLALGPNHKPSQVERF